MTSAGKPRGGARHSRHPDQPQQQRAPAPTELPPMTIDIFQLLADNALLLLFTVIGVGYLLGNIRIVGIELGPVVGVLLVGLLFGHLGFTAPEGASAFGFALFIFSVGIQAGPTGPSTWRWPWSSLVSR
jgi:membrane-bound ClpP family serine protease